jgi:hypothetical protein
MNLIAKYNISKDEVLNSYNFLKRSDIVYAAFIPTADYELHFKSPDNKIFYEQNDLTFFKATNFKVKNGDIVFCNTFFIKQLFQHLNTQKNLTNINLITHQADLSISKSLFRLKPDCVSKWYSTNVEYVHDDLIPIPLGIAITKNQKNLVYDDFYNYQSANTEKDMKIYYSFNVNTNYFHRSKALKALEEDNSVQGFNLNLNDYLINLDNNKFVLCPWGNGVDSHRFWESLYLESVPITKKHYIYEYFNELPKYLVDSYKLIDISNYETTEVNKYIDILKVSWWINLIKNNDSRISNDQYYYFSEDDTTHQKNVEQYFDQVKLIGRYKLILTLLRKIHKFITS